MQAINCNWQLAEYCRPDQETPRISCRLSGATLYVHGMVGESTDSLDSRSVRESLAKLGDRPLTVDINSDGGYVFDGISIYNAIAEYPGKTVAQITGQAASAASIIAMAADRVEMATGTTMLIHLARTLAFGPAPVLEEVARQLGQIDKQLAGIYAGRMTADAEEVYALMRGRVDGTSYGVEEAIAAGLADGQLNSLTEAVAVAAAKIRLQQQRAAL